MLKLRLCLLAALMPVMLTGCALDALGPQPDDPDFAPALPEEDYTTALPSGGLFNPYSSNNGLYTDTRAHKVGDLISVQLEEQTSASKNAGTTLGKSNDIGFGALSIGGRPVTINGYDTSVGLSNSSDFTGNSDASQSNSLTGNISVSVVKVLANGNLVVRGEKWLMLNNGNEYIRVTGIVRSEDVSSDNTVSSQRIANARIQYGGTGDFADTQERGWLSRFFNSAFNIFF
ncbi:MAG: flagellar basal body L-ring protein FlgH [Candidatus Anaerobiospirillum pullicola]|uniref:Flagellar L-ring protein n=1 Tax=Candidatus Anaerobiospirillum pullicola TaxID=2838451 RepID=A0A948THL0_9GAMM|nr:flagellar basal body L-ring protein FlgH [Candidatus Anaerobiospirillum pullicola]